MVSYRLASIYAEQPGKLDVALSLALNAKVQLDTDPAVNDVVGWVYVKKQRFTPSPVVSPERGARRTR